MLIKATEEITKISDREEINSQKEKVSKNTEIKKENKTQDLIFDDEDFILEQPKQVPSSKRQDFNLY